MFEGWYFQIILLISSYWETLCTPLAAVYICTFNNIAGTNHEGDQPAHLTLLDDQTPEALNFAKFAGPEGR